MNYFLIKIILEVGEGWDVLRYYEKLRSMASFTKISWHFRVVSILSENPVAPISCRSWKQLKINIDVFSELQR